MTATPDGELPPRPGAHPVDVGQPADVVRPADVAQPADPVDAVRPADPGEQVEPVGDESAEVQPVGGRPRRGLVLAIALGWLALDAVTKAVVVARLTPGRPVDVVGSVVQFDLLRNPGSAFSLATGYTVILSLVAVAVIVVVVRISGRLRSTAWAVAFGLLLGGALGNLADRVFRAPGILRGYVVDFVALPHWPVFNVADSGISVAAVLIVVLSLLGRSYDGTRTR